MDGSTIFDGEKFVKRTTSVFYRYAIDEALKSARGVGIVNQIRTTLHVWLRYGSMDPTYNRQPPGNSKHASGDYPEKPNRM